MENVYQIQSKRFLFIILASAAVLTFPLVAMRFTDEVKWTVFDFIVAAVLLFGTSLAIEIALRVLSSLWSRVAACAVILLGLFLVWAELAVGVVGTRFAGS